MQECVCVCVCVCVRAHTCMFGRWSEDDAFVLDVLSFKC
jgi:hypothetical protein